MHITVNTDFSLAQGSAVSWLRLGSKPWVRHSCLTCPLILCPAKGLPDAWCSHGQGQLLKKCKGKHSVPWSWLLPLLHIIFSWPKQVTRLSPVSTGWGSIFLSKWGGLGEVNIYWAIMQSTIWPQIFFSPREPQHRATHSLENTIFYEWMEKMCLSKQKDSLHSWNKEPEDPRREVTDPPTIETSQSGSCSAPHI